MTRARQFLSDIKVAALCVAGFVLIVSVPSGAFGQGSSPQRGYQPGASYSLSDMETINTNNGNLMLNLPLGKLPAGRGGLSGLLSLHYDSKLYDSHTQYYQDWDHLVNGQPHVAIRNIVRPSEQGGWHYGIGYSLQVLDRMNQYPTELKPQYPDTEPIYHWKVKMAFPDGSVHEFLPRGFGTPSLDGYYAIRPDGYQTRWGGGACSPVPCIFPEDVPYLTGPLTYYSFDGTFLRLEIQHDSDSNWWTNPWTLYFPDGTKVTNGNKITDRNGNYVEIVNATYNGHLATQLIDQVGRKVVIEGEAISDGQVIHVPGVGGADLTYQVHWKQIQVCKSYSTVINDSYSSDGYPDMIGILNVVSEIDLPSETGGLKYLFGYNASDFNSSTYGTPSNGWGELNSVIGPSADSAPQYPQVQYSYYLDGQNMPMWDVILRESKLTRKSLTYQQQYDGSSNPVTETWNYNSISQGSIINPDGGVVIQVNDAQRNYRTQQPDGTVIEKLWQGNVPQGFPSIHGWDDSTGIDAYDLQRVNGFLKTEFTSIRDAGGTLTKTAIKDYTHDKNGNVISVSEYDWVDYGDVSRGGTWGLPTGIPSSAVLKRVTTNSYARSTPDASDTSSNTSDSYWNSTSPNLRNALASSEVSNGSTTLSRTELFYDDSATTGNLTQQKSWDSTKGGYSSPLTTGNSISTSNTYDSYGNPLTSTDARGVVTTLCYSTGDCAVSGQTADLYPTRIKVASNYSSLTRTTNKEYDFYTGAVTKVTDADNNVAVSTTYDVFGRPTLVKTAEGKTEETRTRTEYDDTLRRVIVRSDLSGLDDGKLVSIQHYDQLGRVRLTRQLEDASTQSATDETAGIKVQTRYVVSNPCQPDDTTSCLSTYAASLGSYQLVSNPYRAAYSSSATSEPTMGWARSRSDKSGRMIEAQTFGGASLPAPWGTNTTGTGAVTTSYNGSEVTVTDQSGKQRKSASDALGRLREVYEDPAGLNYLTSYAYNALGNLTSVTQGSQPQRTFNYDSLGRLGSAFNPESGTVSYTYDNNGNLSTKSDARSITTTYDYDELNRVKTRTYNDGTPMVTYSYDTATNGKGLLASVSSNVSSYSYSSYDALGRVLSGSQGIGSQTYPLSYEYSLAGQVKIIHYPSGHIVTNTYDSAGRLQSLTGKLGDDTLRTYSSAIVYDAAGRMTQEQFGTTTAIFNKLFYNSRGQLGEIREGRTPNDDSFELGAIINFYGGCWGRCAGGSMPYNNGNLNRQEHWIKNSQDQVVAIPTQNYDYDSLNRLQRVYEGDPQTPDWHQTYIYDRWGNRTINQSTTTGIPKPYFGVDTGTNRLTVPSGYSGTMHYDGAGNLDIDTYSALAVARLYDAENRMTKETQANSYEAGIYSYDGDGRRVKRKVGSVETWQVYGLGGELLAEYAENASYSNPQKEYGYRNGQILIEATVPAGSEGSAPTFDDDPLNPNGTKTDIKLVHLTQLRSAVDQLRARAGLSAGSYTRDPYPTQNVTEVHHDHIMQLRAALEPALSALHLPTGAYAHGTIHNGDTIYAIDFQELRNQIKAAWSLTINWLVTDQLGTPRMIFDLSGSLANVSRHDYLPFGEDLYAGSRTAALGYTNSDGARQKFTQKERDNETGLDFFNARYFGSTQGRFTSPDPYNPVVDTDKEEHFNEYLGQPQNWNRYAFVWNNPLKYVDPNGEKVYVVTYTTGNDVDNGGDDELRRAAQTKADNIRASKGFNAKRDTVLLRGVQTKQDFANVIKEANGLNKQFGKVEQINLYSHAGPESGPIFHEASPYNHNQTQFTQQELSNLRVNWSGSATARIYGCNTGVNFAQNFANAQGVPTFGYEGFAYFSNSYTSMIPDQGRQNPLYLIQADYGKASGPGGVLRYELGFGRVYPMVRRNPPPKDRPRR